MRYFKKKKKTRHDRPNGLFLAHRLITIDNCTNTPIPATLGWAINAETGMVFMMVLAPVLLPVGETPPRPRIVCFIPIAPACEVVIMVVGLPSAAVTSLTIVPGGKGPLAFKFARNNKM